MKWSFEQEEVLKSRGCNLLVAAAAGSGKTAVLVERILRLILEGEQPPDLDQILVVTFTQAAAREMKERIRQALNRLSGQGNTRAREQLALVADAPVSTIHSFCLGILREHFHIAGLEPGFRVGEQTECTLMQNEAMDRMLDDVYAIDPLPVGIADLLDCFAGYRGDERLRDRVMDLWRFSRTMPWPEQWMDESVARMLIPEDTAFETTDWGRVLLDQADWTLEALLHESEEGCRLAEDAGFEGYALTFAADMVLLEGLRESLQHGWDAAVANAAALKFGVLKRAPKDADPLTKELLSNIRKKIKSGVTELRETVLSGPSETLCAEIRAEAGRMAELALLVNAFDRTYRRMKRRRNLVDFNDLEHLTLSLLSTPGLSGDAAEPTSLAIGMRGHWHAVMVDEYQDSNLVQETILSAVVTQEDGYGNFFMVGDVKQSIYRFRQAMPELFLGKYARYPLEEGNGTRKILLHRNFRSRSPVLKAVNAAFSRLMTERLGEMAYTEAEALIPGTTFPSWNGTEGAPVSLHLIDTGGGEPVSESAEAESAQDTTISELEEEFLETVEEEAVWAVQTLKKLVNGEEEQPPFLIQDGQGGMRPVRWKDCVVLMRATAGWSQVFTEVFTHWEVPLFADMGGGHLQSMEVGVMLSVLQVLDNPLQDIPLAAVLRSPLFRWSETQMASVRQSEPTKELMEAIRSYDGRYLGQCRDFLTVFERWRTLALTVSVGELLEILYEESGYVLHVAALPGGEQRMANLRLLVDRAARFETTGYRGLFQFIRYVERLQAGNSDFDGARTAGEGADVVRLMSIHKSKGLEYPVVLLCGAGKQFNLRDRQERILLHHRMGFGPDGVSPGMGATWPTAAKRALQIMLLRETLSEEMRILYVAMTRAKERLFICGHVRNASALRESSMAYPQEGPLSAGMVFPMRSYVQWLLAAWMPLLEGREEYLTLHVHTRSSLLHMHVQEAHGGYEVSLPADEPVWLAETMKTRQYPGQASLFDMAEDHSEADRLAHVELEAIRRMDWKPSFPVLSTIPSKMTVTALKRMWEEQEADAAGLDDAFRLAVGTVDDKQQEQGKNKPFDDDEGTFVLPAFRQQAEDKTSGMRYGTLMHLVLQHLEPSHEGLPNLEMVINGLIDRGLILEADRNVPNRYVLERFLHSSLFQRMVHAPEIHRETPFTIRLEAAIVLLNLSIPRTEQIVLQGIVDCWFEEKDGVVLVDYKTDRTMGRHRSYERQLNWYAIALEKMLEKPVKEMMIWYLQLGKAVSVPREALV